MSSTSTCRTSSPTSSSVRSESMNGALCTVPLAESMLVLAVKSLTHKPTFLKNIAVRLQVEPYLVWHCCERYKPEDHLLGTGRSTSLCVVLKHFGSCWVARQAEALSMARSHGPWCCLSHNLTLSCCDGLSLLADCAFRSFTQELLLSASVSSCASCVACRSSSDGIPFPPYSGP